MKFRLHGDALHVHGCKQHLLGCDFFDHAPTWLVGNRDAAREQLKAYRASIALRIAGLTLVMNSIDAMLHRLDQVAT